MSTWLRPTSNVRLIHIVNDVRSGAELISTAAHEAASRNADRSARTETQANALQETAASLEQLTSTVQQSAENALHAKDPVRSASHTAVAGGDAMVYVQQATPRVQGVSPSIHCRG
jgi:methyl-accepting chemotaxis protein